MASSLILASCGGTSSISSSTSLGISTSSPSSPVTSIPIPSTNVTSSPSSSISSLTIDEKIHSAAKALAESTSFSMNYNYDSEDFTDIYNIEKGYIYIDYGEKYTFLHLVNNGKVVNSTFFNNGSDNLVKKVQDEYKISDTEALKLIRIFGFDSSLNAYNPPIVTKNENGYLQTYSKSNLNVTISDYYKELGEYLSSSIKVLLKDHESMISQLPLVFVGKGFKINGLKEYIIRLFHNNIDFVKSNIVGADFNLYINLIGAIYLNDLSNEIFKENVVNVVKENHNLKEGE